MSKDSSYQQILRSTSAIAGATVVNVAFSLVRTKVAAVVLGPAGIGLIGLYQNLIATASSVAALGFGTVGTRQIAAATGSSDARAIYAARRALSLGTLVLAIAGSVCFWLVRDMVALHVLGDPGSSSKVGWLSVAVALTVAAGSQMALLNGVRHIRDIANLSILSGLLSTVLCIGVVLILGENALIPFVLLVPLANFALGCWYVSRLPEVPPCEVSFSDLANHWKIMTTMGVSLMIASLAFALGQLAMRTIVQRNLGAEALGHFQAAWAISVIYTNLVFQGLGADYYPRLSASYGDKKVVNQLVNEHAEVALLLAGPVIIATLGLAPWIVELAYSNQFGDTATIIRWQVLGNVLKVASWPLVFILWAAGDGRAYASLEVLSFTVLAAITWIVLPLMGVEATGVAFVGMNTVYLPVVFMLTRRRTGFAWHRRVWVHFVGLLGIAVAIFSAARSFPMAASSAAVGAATLLSIYGLGRLGHMANLGGALGRAAYISRRTMMRLGVWQD